MHTRNITCTWVIKLALPGEPRGLSTITEIRRKKT